MSKNLVSLGRLPPQYCHTEMRGPGNEVSVTAMTSPTYVKEKLWEMFAIFYKSLFGRESASQSFRMLVTRPKKMTTNQMSFKSLSLFLILLEMPRINLLWIKSSVTLIGFIKYVRNKKI